MVRLETRNWHDCMKMIGLLCLVASVLIQHASGQRVKVEGEVLSYPGQTVNLRCAFTDATGIQLTMVTWIYESKDGNRINIAVFHPNFEPNYPESPLKNRVSFAPSRPNLASPSIQITNVKISDEGKYICEYATYPSGNEQGITYLVMLAKPTNSASITTVQAGTAPVVVARCESANGRPPAQISWVTTANGNATTTSKPGTENTVTVSSEYLMVPTPEDNGKDISCVVAHRTQVKPEIFPLKLAVQYAPQVAISGYDNNWYIGRTNVVLTCQAMGNPSPESVKWKTMSGGEIPDTVQIAGNELKVLKVDDAVNITFVCEVSNSIGMSRDQVTTLVRASPLPPKGLPTGAIIGAIIGVIILLAIIGTVVAMYRKHRDKKLREGPPKYKPPPPKKTNSSGGRQLDTNHISMDEGRPLQDQYYTTQTAEPVTDLDAWHDDDDGYGEKGTEHYFSAAPSGWDDPGDNEVLPSYMHTGTDTQNHQQGPTVNRGDSFVSPAMFV